MDENIEEVHHKLGDLAFPQTMKLGNNILYAMGLTRREIFAAMAMQSIITQCGKHEAINTALYAVQHADALINELNKQQ